jgi:glycosyltransferase involved in cell wall biosynthesis
MDAKNAYSRNLAEKAKAVLGRRFMKFGLFSFAELADFIGLADIMVVPQRNSPASWGQMPAKIFDAMAMGKPIIATAVSDIPTVLDGCGWIVEPANPKALAAAIQEVITNPRLSEIKGSLAREKFLSYYSWDAISPQLIEIFRRYEV